jgi:SAM-dependent methyltransferase
MPQLLELPEPALSSVAHPLCTLCGSTGRELFVRHDVPIYGCSSCGHRFALPPAGDAHVATVYDDSYFSGGGAGYKDYLSEGTLLRQHGRRYGRLLSRITNESVSRPGTVLDVGCAAGFILQGLMDEGWSARGVEPNPAMGRFGRDTLGVDIATSSLEDFHSDTAFDVVTLVQVIAHFVEPQSVIEHVRNLVMPGGYCLVETWNVGSWSARLFGQNWHEYSPPSVLQWYSPTTLKTLFKQHGFEAVAQGRPSKKISVGHARSLLQHGQTTSLLARTGATLLKALPGRLTLPYPSEDLFWMAFRKA